MKVLKSFTEKGESKRWNVGETYTGTRGKELAAKGVIGDDKEELATVFTLPDDKPEKVEVKPAHKNIVASISTQKVNRKR